MKKLIMLLTVGVLAAAGPAWGYGLNGGSWVGGEMSGVFGNTSGTLHYTIDASLDGLGGVPLTGANSWTSEIVAAMDQWDAVINVDYAADTWFTANDITFTGFDFEEANTLAMTSATPTETTSPYTGVTIKFNSNVGMSWTTAADGTNEDIGSVALHELGHSLGLGHTNQNKYDDDDHNAIPSAFAHNSASSNNLPVMAQGVHYATDGVTLREDDIAGVRWIYGSQGGSGSSLVCIDTIGPGMIEGTDVHHGPSWWEYQVTVDGDEDIPAIVLLAGTDQGVTGATFVWNEGTPTVWNIMYNPDRTTFQGPAGFKGDLVIYLYSTKPEGVIDWTIGAQSDSNGKTFGPVPEPATISLVMLGGVALLKRRKA